MVSPPSCKKLDKMEETEKQRIILGIDPGTNFMGYGVVMVMGGTPKLMGMGVLDMKTNKKTAYDKLKEIYDKTTAVIEKFGATEFAIESQFFGKNVQSMLKLGRAQGVAIVAALEKGLPIAEYAPLKIKQSITGNGMASKEQVAGMLQQYLHIPEDKMPEHLDATDAIGVAMCHHFETANKLSSQKKFNSWNDFVNHHSNRIKQ